MKDRELREEVEALKNELQRGWIIKREYWNDPLRVSHRDLIHRLDAYKEACDQKYNNLERKINAILEILDIEEKKGTFLKKGNKEVEI